jgi:hypothetical protein
MNPTDAQLREFLLHRMATDDAARLEEAVILEDGVAERLRAEELDLIDDYAAGRLTSEEQADVERQLLTSAEQVHSLRVARQLIRERTSREAQGMSGTQAAVARPHRWTGRFAATGALLAAGLIAVALIPNWTGTPRPPIQIPPPAADSAIPAPGSAPSPMKAADSPPILTLLADLNRGSTLPSLHWKAGLAAVRLQAEVPEPKRGARYSIRIYDHTGDRLFEGAALPVHAAGRYSFVDTVVPSAALGPGERTISLQSSDAAEGAPAQYTWRIVAVLD